MTGASRIEYRACFPGPLCSSGSGFEFIYVLTDSRGATLCYSLLDTSVLCFDRLDDRIVRYRVCSIFLSEHSLATLRARHYGNFWIRSSYGFLLAGNWLCTDQRAFCI
jgi:hypothetical protein